MLIKLASLHPDKKLAQLATECGNALKTSPADYDKIYISSIQLAEQLNHKSQQMSDKYLIALELAKKEHHKTDEKISKLEHKLDKLQKEKGQLWQIMSKLIPAIGRHLNEKKHHKRESLIDKIDSLKEMKQSSVEKKLHTQKSITKPLMFREHKEKLSKMVSHEPRKSVKIAPKK